MAEKQAESIKFKSDDSELLNLVTHSLYGNKEIFLRELISNASDAIEHLRFESLKTKNLLAGDADFKIRISFDKKKNILTVSDNGIGMSREEVVEHLGTIAKSGTKSFLKSLSGDQTKDSKLIGQFGVGFYSAFILAKKVVVLTRKAGDTSEEGVQWESDGKSTFSVKQVARKQRGTEVVLFLKDEEKEFADDYRLQSLIKKYSDYVVYPIQMQKEITEKVAEDAVDNKPAKLDTSDATKDATAKDVGKKDTDAGASKAKDAKTSAGKAKDAKTSAGKAKDAKTSAGKTKDVKPKEIKKKVWEQVNSGTPIWVLPKSEIDDKKYIEFYKHVSHDFTSPLCWAHNKVEGSLEYTSLLFIAGQAPFDMWQREKREGIKLYVQNVFIMDDAEHLMPNYLRFAKGVVDSNDLPLNVSREILQSNKVITKIKTALVKRVLGMLEKMASADDNEKYKTFWSNFGQVIKEGVVEDFANRDRIAKLLRFSTTDGGSQTQTVSFDQYIKRMPKNQEKIYYITAENHAAAVSSPLLEVFKKKGLEVILLTDRIDEWLVSHLTEFDGKTLQSVAKGALDLSKLEDDKEQAEAIEEHKKTFDDTLKLINEALKDRVKEVRLTSRLTESPSCVVQDENEMSSHMQRLMGAAGQDMPAAKPILELNPEHPLVQHLKGQTDIKQITAWSEILLSQALLAEGDHLTDPSQFIKTLNSLLVESSH